MRINRKLGWEQLDAKNLLTRTQMQQLSLRLRFRRHKVVQ